MIGLTAKQDEALAFIRHCIDENGIPPSFDEIKDALGLASKSGVYRLVRALAERGHITVLRNRARSIGIGPDYRELALRLSTHLLAYEFRDAEKIARDVIQMHEAAK